LLVKTGNFDSVLAQRLGWVLEPAPLV